MRRKHATTWVGLAATWSLIALAGCQSGPKRPFRAAPAEPALGPPIEVAPGAPSAEGAALPAPGGVTWVDRHPLFARPRQLYDSTNGNSVVKAAAATVIGIPVGLFGEVKQIVVGSPAGTADKY